MNSEIEQTPAIQGYYTLSENQIRLFNEEGHLLLRNVATSEEIHAYKPYIDDIVSNRLRYAAISPRTIDGSSYICTDLWLKSNALRKLITAARFAKVAADLLCVRGVRLYYDAVFFNEAGGPATAWYQDNNHLVLLEPEKIITMWMPIEDVTGEMGSLSYISNGHLKEKLRGSKHIYLDALRMGLPVINYGAMKRGDATFHAGWTPYSARKNDSSRCRKAVSIIYFADDSRIIDPGPDPIRKAQFDHYFSNLMPGNKAASHWTPLVYSRDLEMNCENN